MILPNYTYGSIVNLVNSIMTNYGLKSLYEPLRDFTLPAHKNLVLMVIDGLGLSFLQQYGKDSCLLHNTKAELTSVFPSTTAAALTSLMTGVAPLQHGLTGWFMYFRELATAGVPLRFMPRFAEMNLSDMDVDINDLLNFEPIFRRITRDMFLLCPKLTIDSPLSNYCYADKTKYGYEKVEECFAMIEKQILKNEKDEMVFAYIPHFDEVSHLFGINSPEAINMFQHIDNLFDNLVKKTKDTDTLYIITADHGMVDTTPETVLNINDFPLIKECLILPLCGEPRVPYCYVRLTKYEQFLAEVDKKLGKYCHRFSLSDAMNMNLYGIGDINPKFFDRVGDEILVMNGNYVLIDKVYKETYKKFIGFHGGLTRDEMMVPLILC